MATITPDPKLPNTSLASEYSTSSSFQSNQINAKDAVIQHLMQTQNKKEKQVPKSLLQRKISNIKHNLNLMKDNLLGGISFISQKIKECLPNSVSKELGRTEQLDANHINLFAQEFNKSTNSAVILPSIAITIENLKNQENVNTYLNNTVKEFIETNTDLVKKAKTKDQKEVQNPTLRDIMKANGKKIAMLNVNLPSPHLGGLLVGRHWTCIHLNFETNTIYYLDSKKPHLEPKAVKETLRAVQQWLAANDPDNSWAIHFGGEKSPSVLKKSHQKEDFNCGVFTLLFTALAGQGKTYEEMEKIPSKEMYRQVGALRLDVGKAYKENMKNFGV